MLGSIIETSTQTNITLKKSSTFNSPSQVLQANPNWNYDEHGADWPLTYPECGLSHQSPINMLQPVTKWGQVYDIFPFALDNLYRSYYDLEDTLIYLDK